PVSRSTTVLAERPGRTVTSLGRNGSWRAARWSDGVVWRRDPGGREELGTLLPGPLSLPVLMQQPNGRVCTGAGTRIAGWDPGGTSSLLTTLPNDIVSIEQLTDELAVVTLADRGIYRIDLTAGKATSIGAAGGLIPSMARGPGLTAATRTDNGVMIIDLAAN